MLLTSVKLEKNVVVHHHHHLHHQNHVHHNVIHVLVLINSNIIFYIQLIFNHNYSDKDFDPDCCPPECPSIEQPCPSEGILSCPGSPAPSPKRSSPRRSGLVNSSSAMYGSASSGDISVYGASASGNVYGSGSGLNSGYTSNPMYGSQQQQQYSSSGFGSTTLYGSSGIGSFSLEAGSYTPLSFNY